MKGTLKLGRCFVAVSDEVLGDCEGLTLEIEEASEDEVKKLVRASAIILLVREPRSIKWRSE